MDYYFKFHDQRFFTTTCSCLTQQPMPLSPIRCVWALIHHHHSLKFIIKMRLNSIGQLRRFLFVEPEVQKRENWCSCLLSKQNKKTLKICLVPHPSFKGTENGKKPNLRHDINYCNYKWKQSSIELLLSIDMMNSVLLVTLTSRNPVQFSIGFHRRMHPGRI